MRAALAFLTPLGGAREPSPAAVPYFPAVGLLVGLTVGLAWWLSGEIWPPAVAAAIVVAVDLALTGMLHFDGLVDSADGLLPHLPVERRLEVMREPTVGAFGLAAGATTLLLRWAALASLRPAPLLVAGLWTMSRSAMCVTLGTVPYARPGGGLATPFAGGRGSAVAGGAVGLALAAVLALLWGGRGLLAVAGGVAAAAGVVALARRRVGGYTGDVLGAAAVVAETTGLLVAAARP